MMIFARNQMIKFLFEICYSFPITPFPRRYCHNKVKNIQSIRHLYQESPSEQLYKIYGWIRGKVRNQKNHLFVHLDDGSIPNRLQVIIPKCLTNAVKLTNGTSVECIGSLENSLGRQQSIDFKCKSLKVIGECNASQYQIGHLSTGTELNYLREKIHLRPRVKYFQSILRIRNELTKAIRRYMENNHFIEVHVPMITTNDCEGGGECFTLRPLDWTLNDNDKLYFGRPTYLTVSGQFHLEALANSLGRVYTLSPVFRAEKSMSPKHLSEFLMLEVEHAFLFNLNDLLTITESMFKYLIFEIIQNCPDDLQFLLDKNQYQRQFDKLVRIKSFNRIAYAEARQILAEKFPALKNENLNLNSQMEQHLLEINENEPILITDFPSELKPFYMKLSEDSKMTAQCFDLITPICGEVCGGSLRENRLDYLRKQMLNKDMQSFEHELDWYLDLRKFGSVPCGGFGMGFDRFIQTLCGIRNIKDVAPFPRWPYHCYL